MGYFINVTYPGSFIKQEHLLEWSTAHFNCILQNDHKNHDYITSLECTIPLGLNKNVYKSVRVLMFTCF